MVFTFFFYSFISLFFPAFFVFFGDYIIAEL